MNPREAAYIALMNSLKGEYFISHYLDQWQNNHHPSPQDYALAKEIAYGTLRMTHALDHLASISANPQKLSLKLKERALVRLALYQHHYMAKIPLYAIVNETIEIAKKYCHHTFVRFLNAFLRKIANTKTSFPLDHTVEALSTRFSYPKFFVQELLNSYPIEQTLQILEAGNCPSKTMARLRIPISSHYSLLTPIQNAPVPVGVLSETSSLANIASSPNYYIQNITPATLVHELAKHSPPPLSILDLCASPGGKLIAAHDLFPNAKLYGNDISPQKIIRLTDNFTKYNIPVNLRCGTGESYTSPSPFDVIILDVPCSNSGVLNKRPEARWRLNKETLDNLKITQKKLIQHATTLISDKGSIWYITCSILKSENEELINSICEKNHLYIEFSKTILPDFNGWDGGFACLLKKKM